MSGAGLTIRAEIGGRSVSRSEVLAWEARRAGKVCKKLGISAPPGDVVALRKALVARSLNSGTMPSNGCLPASCVGLREPARCSLDCPEDDGGFAPSS